MIEYHITWSIYVQAKTVQKLREAHIPAIEDRIGSPQASWLIEPDEARDGQIRLMAINNHTASSRRDAVLHILGLAGKLSGGHWNVSGLDLLNNDRYFHLTAHRLWTKPASSAPALTDVLIESEAGVYPRTNETA